MVAAEEKSLVSESVSATARQSAWSWGLERGMRVAQARDSFQR